MRTRFLLSGLLLLLVGGGIILYQVSESCEDSALAQTYAGYPWCTDILDHVNLTFIGVMSIVVGIVILALGASLHWILEPGRADSSKDVQTPEPDSPDPSRHLLK